MIQKDSKTHALTYGAMIIAIFGMLLLINRQTGSFFEEVFLYIFPIPMVAYAAIYGWKKSLPVFVGMCLISFLCGSFTSIFYAISQAFIGLAFGTSLNHHRDMTRTLLMVMVLSTLANILSTIVLASLFGYNITAEVAEMRNMVLSAMQKATEINGTQGSLQSQQTMQAMETMLSFDYLKRMYVVAMVLLGALQGYVVYTLSLLILRRLQFPLEQPRPLLVYYPPKWMGYGALALFFVYNVTTAAPLQSEIAQNAAQTLGMFGYLFLWIFGIIALFHIILAWVSRSRIVALILTILAMLVLPLPLIVVGFLYLTGGLHDKILSRFKILGGSERRAVPVKREPSPAPAVPRGKSLAERARMVQRMQEEKAAGPSSGQEEVSERKDMEDRGASGQETIPETQIVDAKDYYGLG